MADALVLAVQNAPVLRALQHGEHPNPTALAKAVGRDPENVRKTLKGLAAAGFVTPSGLLLILHERTRGWLVEQGLDVRAGREQLGARLQALAGDAGREAVIAWARGQYLTPWLNPPFTRKIRSEPPPQAAQQGAPDVDPDEPPLFPPSEEERALTTTLVAGAVASGKVAASPDPEALEREIDERAIRRLSRDLSEKLAAARAKGRSGWWRQETPVRALAHQLLDHALKGDPLDVAAIAMFVHQRAGDQPPDYDHGLRKAARGRVLPADVSAAIAVHREEGRARVALKQLLGAVSAWLAAEDDKNVGFFTVSPVGEEVTPRIRAAIAAAQAVADDEHGGAA